MDRQTETQDRQWERQTVGETQTEKEMHRQTNRATQQTVGEIDNGRDTQTDRH